MKTIENPNANTAESMANAAGEQAKHYVDAGVTAFNNMSGRTRQIGRNADGYVRENPWLVIGAAAGAGLLLGYLIRSRRDS